MAQTNLTQKPGRITSHKSQGGLGLRDINVINGAMMLKTLWKLASKEFEDVPFVQLLKAKYLSSNCLWFAGMPSACTKLWRALLNTRHVLQPCISWQLGTGDKCSVFGEPWHHFWKVLKPRGATQRNLRITDLTVDQGRAWSHEKLAEFLGTGPALHIIGTRPHPPMRNASSGDRLIFSGTKSDKFSLKRACSLLQGPVQQLQPMQTDLLKIIWYCPGLLPRVRLFLWKLLTNAIPTRGTYAAKLGQVTPPCSVCDQGTEDTMHVLFHCPFARSLWFSSGFAIRTELLPPNCTEMLYAISQRLQGEQFVRFANLLWGFWKQRCDTIFRGTRLSINRISHMGAAFDRLSKLSNTMTIPKPLRHIWHAISTQDPLIAISCFVDGSFSNLSNGGWAYVVCYQGILIQYELCAGSVSSPFQSEIFAMHMALKAVERLNITQCIFFTDCHMLQQLVDGRVPLDSVNWQDFNAAMDLLNEFRSWPGFICSYVPRENNLDAHFLANYARISNVSVKGFTYPFFNPSLNIVTN
ncbi:Ribonuclease H-like superfamily protein [Rhynchospora pubera]|uniref:Ribonuclease H-like superfamily protein n=1 Tax=Rhynchospora pubera TaxID=906938 RepID=A0AAV8FXL9_9POAL|nr:Ribonuclease H-like superfamily protein [Rhynchospora pubera]